jgi:hypothetical protein
MQDNVKSIHVQAIFDEMNPFWLMIGQKLDVSMSVPLRLDYTGTQNHIV